jgi:hypothetical protein
MKKLLIILSLLNISLISVAQREDREEEKGLGFRKENVFFGGSINVGFGSVNDPNSGGSGGSNLVLGLNPELGYSFAQWLDAGLVFNAIYNSVRFNQFGIPYRQTAFNYGAGVFARIHPFNSFFIQAQPEHNWIDYKIKNINQPSIIIRDKVQASSFLVGIGYGQRIVGQSSFFTVLLFDVNREINSPYRDGYGNALPIIRGGFNWYLNSSKKKR